MKAFLRKWGNSLGVRIPKVFAVHMGMEEGQEIEVHLEQNTIVIRHAQTLDALLEQITRENMHGETDTGAPIGREAW